MKKRPPRITGGPSVARLEQREHFFLGQWPVNDAIVLQLARNQSDDVFQLVTRHAGIPQARRNVELRDEPFREVRAFEHRVFRIRGVQTHAESRV